MQNESFTEAITSAWDSFWSTTLEYLPQFVGALLIVVAGAIIAKLLESLTEKVLEMFGVNKIKEQKDVSEVIKKHNLDFDIINGVKRTVFWVVILVTAMVAADALQLNAAENTLQELLAYVPNVLAAVIVLGFTVGGAQLARRFVQSALERMNVIYARGIALISWAAILVFGALIAFDQLQFEVQLLQDSAIVIVMGVMLALALAFGLGGRDVAGNLLAGLFNKHNLNIGDKLTVGGVKGTVESINDTGVTVKTSKGSVHVPHNKVMRD